MVRTGSPRGTWVAPASRKVRHADGLSTADEARQQLGREADLAQQFARVYRAELGRLIERLNRSAAGANGSGHSAADPIRHCVEAVDLVLASDARFARSLKRLASSMDAKADHRAA